MLYNCRNKHSAFLIESLFLLETMNRALRNIKLITKSFRDLFVLVLLSLLIFSPSSMPSANSNKKSNKEKQSIQQEIDAEKRRLEEERKAIVKLLRDERQPSKIEQIVIEEKAKVVVSYKEDFIEVTGIGIDKSEIAAANKAEEAAEEQLFKSILYFKPAGRETLKQKMTQRRFKLTPEELKKFMKRIISTEKRSIKKLDDGRKVSAGTKRLNLSGSESSLAEITAPIYEAEEKEKGRTILSVPKEENIEASITDPSEREAIKSAYSKITNSGRVTGLIIDAQGLNYHPNLHPGLITEDGKEIYGIIKVSHNYIVNVGMAGWALNIKGAESNPRVGENPLIIRAIGISEDNKLIIKTDDALNIMIADDRYDFLGKCRVVIVVGS